MTSIVLVLTHDPAALRYFAPHPPLQSLALLVLGASILGLQPTSLGMPALKAQRAGWHVRAAAGAASARTTTKKRRTRTGPA